MAKFLHNFAMECIVKGCSAAAEFLLQLRPQLRLQLRGRSSGRSCAAAAEGKPSLTNAAAARPTQKIVSRERGCGTARRQEKVFFTVSFWW